jgi:DNA polymerase V
MQNSPTQFLAAFSNRKIPLGHALLPAGTGVDLMDETHDLLDVNQMITDGKEFYKSFLIDGDSMVDEIPPHSFVFVNTERQPEDGSIVVARVNGRHTIKIFERKNHGIRLVAANGKYLPQVISDQDDFSVLGVVEAHLVLHKGSCAKAATARR